MKRVLISFAIVAALAISSLGFAEGVVIIGNDAQNGTTYSGGVELKPREKIKESGDYSIAYEEVRFVSDEKLKQGYWWYFVSSKDDGAEEKRIEYPIGTHMPIYIRFTFTNMNKSDTELLKRVQGL